MTFHVPSFTLLLCLLAVSIVLIPLIGGLFLLAGAKVAKIPNLSYVKCWVAYLAAYATASIGGTVIISLLPEGLATQTGTAMLFFIAAIAVHVVIVPLVLKTTYARAVLAHSLAILAYGCCLAVVLIPLLLRARTVARSAASVVNLHVIGRCFQTYEHENNDQDPPSALYDSAGKPLLSWRVLLLPQFGDAWLYDKFHLDEPWDSAHNKALLSEMPRYYRPLPGVECEAYSTFYQRFVDETGESIAGLRTSFNPFTFIVVEAKTAVPWTKPADIVYSSDKPVPELGGQFNGGFNALYSDGHVESIPHGTREEHALRKSIEGKR